MGEMVADPVEGWWQAKAFTSANLRRPLLFVSAVVVVAIEPGAIFATVSGPRVWPSTPRVVAWRPVL